MFHFFGGGVFVGYFFAIFMFLYGFLMFCYVFVDTTDFNNCSGALLAESIK